MRWLGGKSRQLSPKSADKAVEAARLRARKRRIPRARISATSARRSSALIWSAESGFGMLIGAGIGWCPRLSTHRPQNSSHSLNIDPIRTSACGRWPTLARAKSNDGIPRQKQPFKLPDHLSGCQLNLRDTVGVGIAVHSSPEERLQMAQSHADWGTIRARMENDERACFK